jgi:hypothetical protein
VYERLDAGDELILEGLKTALETTRPEQSGGLSGEGGATLLEVRVLEKGLTFRVVCELSPREREVLLAGGLTNWVRQNLSQ